MLIGLKVSNLFDCFSLLTKIRGIVNLNKIQDSLDFSAGFFANEGKDLY